MPESNAAKRVRARDELEMRKVNALASIAESLWALSHKERVRLSEEAQAAREEEE